MNYLLKLKNEGAKPKWRSLLKSFKGWEWEFGSLLIKVSCCLQIWKFSDRDFQDNIPATVTKKIYEKTNVLYNFNSLQTLSYWKVFIFQNSNRYWDTQSKDTTGLVSISYRILSWVYRLFDLAPLDKGQYHKLEHVGRRRNDR